MKVREFQKQDWDAFAGCVDWSDGMVPLISIGEFEDGKEFVVVFDPTGTCLVIEDHPQSFGGGWIIEMAFPTQEAARAFAEGIQPPKCLADFLMLGFKEV